MDVELARTFLAVVETGSFLKAADRVHVTQSTVSIRIRTLEQQLGKTLFERNKSGASMTAAGRHFQKHAQALLRTWTQAKLDVALPADVEAALEIGAVPSLWDGFLIRVLPAMKRSYQSLALKAMSAPSDSLAKALDDGLLDLVVTYRLQSTVGLVVEQLFEDEFVLVTSNPDLSTDPFGADYILMDWGPEFRADHLLKLPELQTPRLQLGLGTLGLRYLQTVPSSGYFPKRLVEQEAASGWLRIIGDAPTFTYTAYAVLKESQRDDVPGDAARLLKRLARNGH